MLVFIFSRIGYVFLCDYNASCSVKLLKLVLDRIKYRQQWNCEIWRTSAKNQRLA